MEKVNLVINKPCSENFNTFTKTDNGGFCNLCKKTVVDFTKMNDQQILNYFSRNESKTCGLFLESQLKTYSIPANLTSKQKLNPFISSIFGFSLLSVLSFNNGFSQEKTKINETVKVENSTTKKIAESTNVEGKFTVKGIVSDEFGPLPGANVYLKNYDVSTHTDFDGKFTFPKQLKIGDILIVTYIGFKEKEFKITKENEVIKLTYDVSEPIIMGDVSTNKVYKTKRTFFQKIKSFFTNA